MLNEVFHIDIVLIFEPIVPDIAMLATDLNVLGRDIENVSEQRSTISIYFIHHAFLEIVQIRINWFLQQ